MPMKLSDLPPVLYKFMPASFDGGKTLLPVLKSGHIRFTQPQGMNDPYEIQGSFRDETNYESLFDEVREQQLKAARAARVRGHQENIPLPKLVAAFNEIKRSGVLENGEMAERAMEFFREKLFNYGILSMSTNWESSAMWSHYAETHSGICLGFDSRMELFHRTKHKGILSLRKVHYCDERVPLAIGSRKSQVPNDLFFRKSSDWCYEEEWRVVARFSDLPPGTARKNGVHHSLDVVTLPIDLTYVTEILVGSKAERSVKEAALQFARSASHKINVFQMRLGRHSFRMERVGPL
jgi:hypothetical protein